MATKKDSVLVTLSAEVGYGGSFTASYPTGKGPDDYVGGTDHWIYTQSYRALSAKAGDFRVTFGASTITVSMTTGIAMANGTKATVALDRGEIDDELGEALADSATMTIMQIIEVDLGTPAALDVDGIFTTYTGSAPAINGALATGGVATFDVPRNIVIDSGGADAAVLTFTGTDAYGQVMRESITLNGTTAVLGKKAFKTITGVTSSGAIANGAFAGTGSVLGLPVYVGDAGHVAYEMQDGATASAGIVVAGDNTPPTATTGDVRGTYDPDAAPNGTREFKVGVAVRSRSYSGLNQFAG